MTFFIKICTKIPKESINYTRVQEKGHSQITFLAAYIL